MKQVFSKLAVVFLTSITVLGSANSNGYVDTDSLELGFTKNADGSVTAPDGLVWFPVIKRADGSVLPMTFAQAMTCCNAGPKKVGYPDACPFGAGGQYLPSIGEFITLRDQLGYGSPLGYDNTPVPDLGGRYFWSSSIVSQYLADYLSGTSGKVFTAHQTDSKEVRCVGR